MASNQPLHWLDGFIADLPTPFDGDDRIDWAAFEMLCEHQIRSGATAVVVGETMGEASTLSPMEHDEIVGTAVGIARGRIAVIAGAGSNSTNQAIELTTEAEAAGADAVLSVVPYYNRPMQAGILAHFQAIAGSTGLPVILHDVPSRTLRELSDETIIKLAESKQFAGLKESGGSVERLLRLKPKLPPAFRLLCGNDATAMAYLASGGDGCISIVANLFPGLCRAVHESCAIDDLRASRELSGCIAPLSSTLAGDSPVSALKYGMSVLGFMKPAVRLPLVELDKDARTALADVLAHVCERTQEMKRRLRSGRTS